MFLINKYKRWMKILENKKELDIESVCEISKNLITIIL